MLEALDQNRTDSLLAPAATGVLDGLWGDVGLSVYFRLINWSAVNEARARDKLP